MATWRHRLSHAIAAATHLRRLSRSSRGEQDVEAAAVAAYRASIDSGSPVSARKLAAMFGKTSRRWARNRMADARKQPAQAMAESW
jgi:hypothetical protein